jgi:hypothetical protein
MPSSSSMLSPSPLLVCEFGSTCIFFEGTRARGGTLHAFFDEVVLSASIIQYENSAHATRPVRE